MRRFIFGMVFILILSCDRENDFDAVLVEGSAPTDVQANLQFNNMTPPFSVTISPTAKGATAFEVLSGLPAQSATLIGIQQSLTLTYPDSEENFFVTIRAIAANDKVNEQQFELVPPADPCAPIFGTPLTWDNGGESSFEFGFNGAEVQVVENPDPSGANPEVSNVLEITQDGGGNFDGIGIQMLSNANFNDDDKIIRLNFWSNIEVPVKFAVQQDPNNETEREAEVTVIHTGSGWEELRVDFSTATAGFTGNADGALGVLDFAPFSPSGAYIRFAAQISPGDDVAGTFYLDNIGVCP